MSTMRRPAAAHMRGWLASAAGIDEAPGSARPSASAIAIMVAAVPITMQVPNERAMPPSISFQSLVGDVAGALLGPVFPHVRAGAEELAAPVAAQHRPRRHVDRRDAHADRAHDQAGRGLVAAAHQHRAVDRMAAQELLRLHGEEVAVEHGARASRTARRATSPAARSGSRRPAARRASRPRRARAGARGRR